MNIYDYVVKNDEGKDVSMSEYKGKVLLIVNTATGCGFTPQYEGLEELYKKYQSQGLEILDFPCNQFGEQAPGSIQEIKEFCQLNYDTNFPLFAKIDVNGEKEEPLFTYLKSQQGGLFGSKIKWNFTKFLINREGNIVERFAPTITPDKMEKKIVELL
jgi:glutathione peroxidase